MVEYTNGYIPYSYLVTFKTGYNSTDGEWNHSLSPSTYAKHKALVARALARTGRTLAISNGWSAYRPYAAQVLARKIWGVGAAVPGTSSHGGLWEQRQTLAMDYGNWSWVYEKYGTNRQDEFFADCRAVGLTPGMIMRSRGYPDEPWHVIDLNPWAGGTAAGSGETDFDMPLDANADYEAFKQMMWRFLKYDSRDGGAKADHTLGPTVFERLNASAKPTDLSGIPAAVWKYMIAARNVKGELVVPAKYYEAGGYLSSTNALVGDMSQNPTAISDEQIKAIADAVAAQIPDAKVEIDYAKIAADVREKFATDPLK